MEVGIELSLTGNPPRDEHHTEKSVRKPNQIETFGIVNLQQTTLSHNLSPSFSFEKLTVLLSVCMCGECCHLQHLMVLHLRFLP